jgi:hypothetical protein
MATYVENSFNLMEEEGDVNFTNLSAAQWKIVFDLQILL